MQIKEFFRLVCEICNSGNPDNKQSLTKGEHESVVIKSFFDFSPEGQERPEPRFLPVKDVFREKRRQTPQFFGYYPGKPDRVFSSDGTAMLLIECKVLRVEDTQASEHNQNGSSVRKNNACEIRNAFFQLGEYMKKAMISPKICEAGTVVVFDVSGERGQNPEAWELDKQFVDEIRKTSYAAKIYLIWIWPEDNSIKCKIHPPIPSMPEDC